MLPLFGCIWGGLIRGGSLHYDTYLTYITCSISTCKSHILFQVYLIHTFHFQAKFLSLLMDGSTDSSVQEQEIIYIRSCTSGVIQNSFVAFAGVEFGKAVDLFKALVVSVTTETNLTEKDLYKKLVAFGSDGAAVMQGKKGGVATLLKNESQRPQLQAIHCMAHRLELAFKSAKKESVMTQVDDLLLQLYLFYHGSPKNRSLLRVACKALGVPCRIPTRVGGTRWIPHLERAFEVLWSVYTPMLQQFLEMQEDPTISKDAKAKSRGFYNRLVNRDILWLAHLLNDIIIVLARLSTTFQADQCTVSEVKTALESTQNSLQAFKSRAGPMLRKVQTVHNAEEFNSHKLVDARRPIESATVRQETLNTMVGKLDGCFADVDSGLIKACRVATFSTWPRNKDDATDFGNSDVETLVDTLEPVLTQAGLQPQLIEIEWTDLKSLVFETFNDVSSVSWAEVNKRSWSQKCLNILGLMDYILTLPASSAICERGFNQMKRIKSDFRSRMTSATLTMLMRILVESPSMEEFNPMIPIDLWDSGTPSGRARRPDTLPYGKRDSKIHDKPNSDSASDCSDAEQCDDETELQHSDAEIELLHSDAEN